jgi:hypothetical protein
MRKGSTISMYAAAILLCAAGVAMAFVGDVLDGRMPKNPLLGSTIDPSLQSPRPAGANMDERLNNVTVSSIVTTDMRVFWITRYSRCGHEKVREEPPEARFTGMTVSDFSKYYPDCTLELEGGQIRMVRTIDQYCPDHYYIKSDDSGNIYVYRNMEGLDKLTMVMKLNFTTASVPQDYRPLLKEGMAFGSIEEIEGLIEDAES